MFSASKTAGPSGYNISRSVRLRSSASAYFSRTLTTPTNNKIWTWSGWVKRGVLGSAQVLLSSDVGTSNTTWLEFGFDAADTFTITAYTSDLNTTSAVFRDPSAWYHVVVAFDTTQATAANRCKIYFNGVQQTLTGAGFTLNAGYGINSAQIHGIGYRNWASGVGRYLDGYMTEINFIDGQALTPSSFGSTNASTGVWQPAKYTGTYGTNGFYLNFSDNSAATAAAIGKDYSGNGNNWTPNNISVTAGATYDSMIDVPTPYADGSTNRGNYCVLNPLAVTTYPGTLSEANLKTTTPTTGGGNTYGTMALPASGQYYWEVLCTNTNAGSLVGVASYNPAETYLFNNTNAVQLYATGQKYVDGVASAYGSAMGTNATIGVAANCDTGAITFYINNVSQGSISHAMSGLFPVFSDGASATGEVATFNFGQRPFTYTPPSGFKALNTYNLPASTVLNGGKYMAATTYTSSGGSDTVVNTANGVSFKPDLVWTKSRNNTYNNILVDSNRGVGKDLYSNSTSAETSDPTYLTAFNSNGYSIGADYPAGTTMVGWQWQAGQGSTSSNTSGSITSTVSVNATAGFSVVTYTATGANATVGHGLGVAPSMIIYKARSGGAGSWTVGHKNMASSNPWNSVIFLDLTNAAAASGGGFNNTAPTSSVFSIGGAYNPSTWTMVAYCWSEIAGFSKFGSYTGNGSADGPFVYCGFRPRFVMLKSSSTAGTNWFSYDTSRSTYNLDQLSLLPNDPTAELNNALFSLDILSNGFKIRTSDSQVNPNGATYIFAAFAENPFQNSLAR